MRKLRACRKQGLPAHQADLDIRDLRFVEAVSLTGGFRSAAEYLGIGPAVLSRRLRSVEDRLGVSLFERHRSGARLTNAGRNFFADAEPILLQLDQAVAAASSAGIGGQGRLKLGLTNSISSSFTNCLIRGWRTKNSTVTTELVEAPPAMLMTALAQRRIDALISSGNRFPRNCEHEVLWRDDIFVVLPATDALADREEIELSELTERNFVVSAASYGQGVRDYLVRHLGHPGFRPSVTMFEVSRETLLTMVGLGWGITLATRCETGISYPETRFVRLRADALPFSVVWVPENDNPALRRMLSLSRVLARQWRRDPSSLLDCSSTRSPPI